MQLKHALTQASMLSIANFELPFVVECDASGGGFGIVLQQEGWRIAYTLKH